jgi:hypothetical protein
LNILIWSVKNINQGEILAFLAHYWAFIATFSLKAGLGSSKLPLSRISFIFRPEYSTFLQNRNKQLYKILQSVGMVLAKSTYPLLPARTNAAPGRQRFRLNQKIVAKAGCFWGETVPV